MRAVVDEIERRAERAEAGAGEEGASTSIATLARPRQPQPPRRITFRPIDASTLPDLKALNAALFPVNYGPRVYEQALAAGGISHGAFFEERELVGAITVRLEAATSCSSSLFVSEDETNPSPPPPDESLARMYVMTVGVLSAWRGQGIGERF